MAVPAIEDPRAPRLMRSGIRWGCARCHRGLERKPPGQLGRRGLPGGLSEPTLRRTGVCWWSTGSGQRRGEVRAGGGKAPCWFCGGGEAGTEAGQFWEGLSSWEGLPGPAFPKGGRKGLLVALR